MGTRNSSRLALLGGAPAVTTQAASWPSISAEVECRILNALRSRRLPYSAHSVTRDFENAFAQYHGRAFAIAANSGTSALTIGFYACGAGELPHTGDVLPWQTEVVVPAYGFFATASALLPLGIRPIFCDAQRDTGNLNPAHLTSLINERTRGIAVTHVAGHPADMDDITRIAREAGLFVLEDCSHAHGARYRGRLVGTFGSGAAFSLQSEKLLSCGEGGVFLCESPDIASRAALFGNFRRAEGCPLDIPPDLAETGWGLKLRISPLSAAMASWFLDNIEALVAARHARLAELSKRIEDKAGHVFAVPITKPGSERGAWYEFHVRLSPEMEASISTDVVRRALGAEGVGIKSSNTKSIHRLGLFKRFHRPGAVFPVADALESSSIVLSPLTDDPFEIVDQYTDAFQKVAENIGALIDFAKTERGARQ